MYGSYTSYGSYGSYSSMSAPTDTAPSYLSSRAQDASCAFPSWPRRSSLSEADSQQPPTSFISDDDLAYFSDPFEDDARSVSSAGSCASPMMQSPRVQTMTEADIEELERERAAHQREVMRFLLNEKERRRQQALRRTAAARGRTSSSSSSSTTSSSASSSARKSPKSKLSAMTPIAEAE